MAYNGVTPRFRYYDSTENRHERASGLRQRGGYSTASAVTVKAQVSGVSQDQLQVRITDETLTQ
jgi:hypothetical protein